MQARAALSDICDKLVLHTAFPEFPDVIENSLDRFFFRKIGEIEGDLIRVVDHLLTLPPAPTLPPSGDHGVHVTV
jgi:hypothetical protein